MRHLIDTFLTLLIPLIILIYLCIAPFTKVEESFNIQATHDILTYGIPWGNVDTTLRKQYDHLTFTGPVPRTFVGPLALASASWPFIWLANGWGGELGRQLIVRAVLGTFNAGCLLAFGHAVAKNFGRDVAIWYTLFQAGQFHIMFYASRTLPNFFAFGLATLAQQHLLPVFGRSPAFESSSRRYIIAILLLTISGIVFRSEIALLLFCHALYLTASPYIRVSISSIILPAGLLGAAIGLILTVPVDSFFWRSSTPLWPELTGFVYNIIHSNAQQWGVQTWHFYFTSALPRLMFNPLLLYVAIPFALLSPIIRRPALDMLIPNLAFVVIYSAQPHKEWRFIVYIIPPLIAIGSLGASWIWTRRGKNVVYGMLSLALIASTLASFIASGGMLLVSSLNYPGGEALIRLHDLTRSESGVVKVHMSTLACMSGVTRFLQKAPPSLAAASLEGQTMWIYDKTEDEETLLSPLFWQSIDYALAEHPERVLGSWEVIDTIYAYVGIGLTHTDISSADATSRIRTGGKELVSTLIDALHSGRLDYGSFGVLQHALMDTWYGLETLVQRHVTFGWWVKIKMEPKIRIMKRQIRLMDAYSEADVIDEQEAKSGNA